MQDIHEGRGERLGNTSDPDQRSSGWWTLCFVCNVLVTVAFGKHGLLVKHHGRHEAWERRACICKQCINGGQRFYNFRRLKQLFRTDRSRIGVRRALFRIAHTEEEKKQKQQGSEEHLCEEVVSEEVKVVREVGGYSWIVLVTCLYCYCGATEKALPNETTRPLFVDFYYFW